MTLLTEEDAEKRDEEWDEIGEKMEEKGKVDRSDEQKKADYVLISCSGFLNST